jgi:hypothetical protein
MPKGKVTVCHRQTEKALTVEVIRLDFMPDKEFHHLFIRISNSVDLRRAFTPEEVNKRIIHEAKGLKFLAKEGYVRPKAAYHRADNLEKLVYTAGRTDFGTRAISTARRHPDGLENLTLNYGYSKAVDILLERNRRLRRMTRTRRR